MKTYRAISAVLLALFLGASLVLGAAPSPRVRNFVGEQEIEGTLQVLVEDRAGGRSRLTFLVTDSGERYQISAATEPTRLATGARVKVIGLKIDGVIAVDSGRNDIQPVSGVSTAGVEASATQQLADNFKAVVR